MEATTPADHDMEGALAPDVMPTLGSTVLYLNSVAPSIPKALMPSVGKTQQNRPWGNWVRGTAKKQHLYGISDTDIHTNGDIALDRAKGKDLSASTLPCPSYVILYYCLDLERR
jgi:hypothetical protein